MKLSCVAYMLYLAKTIIKSDANDKVSFVCYVNVLIVSLPCCGKIMTKLADAAIN